MIPRRRAHHLVGDRRLLLRRTFSDGGGDPVGRLEEDIAHLVGVPAATAVSSGRRAMTLILGHLGVGEGDEVVVPAYTLKDLVPLIQGLGARAVPADVDPRTMNLDPDAVAGRLTDRTKAILVLHAFGNPCDIHAIGPLARERGIPVVEDCAHSLGASLGDRQTGSFARAGFFSFETTKPLNTLGGGMVVSADAELHEAVRRDTAGDVPLHRPLLNKAASVQLEQWMMTSGLSWPMLALLATPAAKRSMESLYRRFQHAAAANARYMPVQAEMGLRRLPGLGDRIRARNEAAALYREALDPRVQLQRTAPDAVSTVYFLVARLPGEAAAARRRLLARGIDAAVGDEIADDVATVLGFDDCPGAGELDRHALVLPLWDGIGGRTIRRVADALNRAI